MDKKYLIHLTSCIYYLINLFYKTDCQYSSSNKKINILLTIYTLCNLKENNNLKLIVDNDILNVMIPENMLCREIYRRVSYNDNNQKIEDKYTNQRTTPYYYQHHIERIELTKENKELLENIFLSFGAYELDALYKLLKEIQTTIPFKNNLTLDVDEFILYLNTNSIIFNNNDIFNFIRDYYYTLNEKEIPTSNDILKKQKIKKTKEEVLPLLVSHMLGFSNQKYELEKQFQNSINTSNKEELSIILEKIEEISKLEQRALKKIKQKHIKNNRK